MLYLVGIGLRDARDITLKGLDVIKKCDVVYLEGYTSLLSCSLSEMATLYGKPVTVIARPEAESDFLLTEAARRDVALLVIGDPFCATTHSSLMLEARGKGIPVEIIHNASILTAIGETGLSLYKFGRVVSLTFDMLPLSVYHAIQENQRAGLHTLCLLDIQTEKEKFMTVNKGIHLLLSLEEREKQGVLVPSTLIFGLARLGGEDQLIKAGTIMEVEKMDFGAPPHSIVIPSLFHHFIEDEWINEWRSSTLSRTAE